MSYLNFLKPDRFQKHVRFNEVNNNPNKSLIELHKNITAINELPYEPINKFSAMTYNIENNKIHFIKGSPEVILSKCNISKEKYENFDTLLLNPKR